jgi:spore maturation protein CgeB
VIPYRLDQRIDMAHKWLHVMWRKKSKADPSLTKPNSADVMYQAGIGALEMALRHQVDCVLVVSAMFMHPDVIVMMRRAGVQVAVLFTESPYDIEKEIPVAKLVHGCWTNERTSVEAFEAACPRAGYLPHGWHPERHKPGPQDGDDAFPQHDVVFVGSGFHERLTWLMEIDWTGIDLGLYGSWESVHKRHPLRKHLRGGVVDNAQTAALYRRAKVGLNLYRTSMGWGKYAPAIERAESLNPRAYELAACGAFHLSTQRAEVSEVFGRLVPTFSTAAEASALIRAWVSDDIGRERIRQQLPACVAESSWVERASRVIGDLQTLVQVAA